MRLTIAVLGGAVVVLIGLVGREIAGPRAGLIAAAITAVYPCIWAHDGLIMSETLAAFAAAAVAFCTYRLLRDPAWQNAVGVGVACAVAMLSRGELVAFLPLLVLPAVACSTHWSRRTRSRLTVIAVIAAVVAVPPWVGYNLARFERPVVISHTDGGVLAGANCRATYSGELIGSWLGLCRPKTPPGREPSVVAEEARSAGMHYVRAHLDRLPVVLAAREGRTWGVYQTVQMSEVGGEDEGIPTAVWWAEWAMYFVLIPIAVGGAIMLRSRHVRLWPVLAPVAIVALVTALFYGQTRFRVPRGRVHRRSGRRRPGRAHRSLVPTRSGDATNGANLDAASL